jgi:protein-tyrosine phosphatase
MSETPVVSVLFVCLGNICRSSTAHGVFETLLDQRGLSHRVRVDSCGTGDWHVGQVPDPRAVAEAGKRGYDLSHFRARQVRASDFRRFDYVLAMDRMNLADLELMCPADFAGHLGLFLPFAAEVVTEEVPDPYYGGADGFSQVLELVEAASEGLLQQICAAQEALDAGPAR